MHKYETKRGTLVWVDNGVLHKSIAEGHRAPYDWSRDLTDLECQIKYIEIEPQEEGTTLIRVWFQNGNWTNAGRYDDPADATSLAAEILKVQ